MIQSFIADDNYRVTHSNGRHVLYADEPPEKGGKDTAPTPDELLEAALASCTLVTLRMYSSHKQWNVGNIHVSVSLVSEKEKSIIASELQFEHALTDEQKQRLAQVAKACPVSKTLGGINELLVEVK
jgi:putative redox protein